MAKRRVDTNPDLQKEQAEGERDTAEQALERDDDIEHGGRDAGTPGGEVPMRERQGVTNQPLGEEEEQQRQLPPRGQAKKGTPGGHA